MRLRSLALASPFIIVLSPAAMAQDAAPGAFDAQNAVRAFLSDPQPLGTTSASFGTVTVDGDTVTVSDVEMRWDVSFDVPGTNASIEASVSAPTLVVTGLTREGAGYGAERIQMPTIDVDVSAGPGGVSEDGIVYDLTLNGYEVLGASWDEMPVVQANPAAPVSRFAPLLHWAATQSYERTSVGSVTGTVTVDGQAQEVSYPSASFGPVENGVVATFEYGEIVSTQMVEDPAGDPFAYPPQMTEMTMRYGPVTGTNLDIKPMIALMTGIDPGNGPRTMLGSMRVEGMTFDVGDAVRVAFGATELADVTVDATRGPIMTQLDGFVTASLAGEEPDPREAIELVLDAYGAFGIGRFAFADMSATFPDGTASLGGMTLENLNAEGLGRLAIEGLTAAAPGDFDFALGSFELSDFTFPAREAFMDAVGGAMMGMQDPTALLAAAPTLGGVTVEGVRMTDQALAGTMTLGRFAISAPDYIGAVPTGLQIELSDLSVPASVVPDPMAQQMVMAVGADPIEANLSFDLAWDESGETVTLDDRLSVVSIGRLNSQMEMSGIPRFIFENPMRGAEALVTAALEGASVRYEDDGLVPFALGMMAQQNGMTPQDMITGMVQQITQQVGALTGDVQLAATIAGEVEAFLTNPQSLTLRADPPEPVPLAQLGGAALVAPQALVEVLGLKLTANAPAE